MNRDYEGEEEACEGGAGNVLKLIFLTRVSSLVRRIKMKTSVELNKLCPLELIIHCE